MVMAMAGVALAVLVLLPRPAGSPEPPTARLARVALRAPEPVDVRTPVGMVAVIPERPQRVVRYRPASTIDDAVRQRAYQAVARSLESESS
jgi:hypothetical protein